MPLKRHPVLLLLEVIRIIRRLTLRGLLISTLRRLTLRLELIMDYITSANLPDPYASDGIDISRVAREIAENADKVTDIIATIDKILES